MATHTRIASFVTAILALALAAPLSPVHSETNSGPNPMSDEVIHSPTVVVPPPVDRLHYDVMVEFHASQDPYDRANTPDWEEPTGDDAKRLLLERYARELHVDDATIREDAVLAASANDLGISVDEFLLRMMRQDYAHVVLDYMREQHYDYYADSWTDHETDGTFVVAVTGDLHRIRESLLEHLNTHQLAAFLVPHLRFILVEHSEAHLYRVYDVTRAALDSLQMGGYAEVSLNSRQNRVEVGLARVDAELEQVLTSLKTRFGSALTVRALAEDEYGVPLCTRFDCSSDPIMRGGLQIYPTGGPIDRRCSGGVMAYGQGNYAEKYATTAGHCYVGWANLDASWGGGVRHSPQNLFVGGIPAVGWRWGPHTDAARIYMGTGTGQMAHSRWIYETLSRQRYAVTGWIRRDNIRVGDFLYKTGAASLLQSGLVTERRRHACGAGVCSSEAFRAEIYGCVGDSGGTVYTRGNATVYGMTSTGHGTTPNPDCVNAVGVVTVHGVHDRLGIRTECGPNGCTIR